MYFAYTCIYNYYVSALLVVGAVVRLCIKAPLFPLICVGCLFKYHIASLLLFFVFYLLLLISLSYDSNFKSHVLVDSDTVPAQSKIKLHSVSLFCYFYTVWLKLRRFKKSSTP